LGVGIEEDSAKKAVPSPFFKVSIYNLQNIKHAFLASVDHSSNANREILDIIEKTLHEEQDREKNTKKGHRPTEIRTQVTGIRTQGDDQLHYRTLCGAIIFLNL
jgi:uncharacterized protein YktB (UPF0637 family)